ncbi:MAG: RNA 2',3'-cyclic phosphodiesterase [Bacteroidales bacterium]|nr:RNA 2',3'-cyclic phosphodiesterase [Bacteroidales bacterium]
MKRLFAAVKFIPGDSLLSSFLRLKTALRNEKITWVDPNNLHVTLKFFGETDTDLIPGIIHELEAVARKHSPFHVKIKDQGFFGSAYKPRVIWFGIESSTGFIRLGNDVMDAAEKAGFGRDRQNFVPHLTIGRIKFLSNTAFFRDTIGGHQPGVLLETEVKSFILYESILRPQRPEYIPLREFRF